MGKGLGEFQRREHNNSDGLSIEDVCAVMGFDIEKMRADTKLALQRLSERRKK